MKNKLIIYYPLTRKALHVALVLFFSLSFISVGAQAQIDCDKMSCSRGSMTSSHHMDMSLSRSAPPMGCCSGTLGSPCTFETSKKTAIPEYAVVPNRVNNTDPMHHTVTGVANYSSSQDLVGFDFGIQYPTKTRSSPIYMQTLSLRC
jgi:hypothetical protein